MVKFLDLLSLKIISAFSVSLKKDGLPIDISLVKSQIITNIKNEKGFPYMIKKLEVLAKKTTVLV